MDILKNEPPTASSSGDPADRLSGRLVSRILDFLLVAVILFAAVVLVGPGPKPLAQSVTLGVAVVVLYGLRRLARTGRVRAAAIALCALGWIAVAMDLPVHGPNTIAVGGFVIVVVIGGLAVGPAAALALAGATVLLLGAVMLGAPGTVEAAPSSGLRLTHYATQLSFASVLVAWWATHTRGLVRQLRASEAQHAQLLEESPDAIISVDRGGIITFWNRAAEKLLGYSRSEVVGRSWSEVGPIPPALAETVRGTISSAVESASAIERDLELPHRDGRLVPVEARSMPLRDEGRVVGIVSILRDISERKRTEVEGASLREQLLSAQRMEAVGRFAGGIAHDFNNILTIILSAAEVAGADASKDTREAMTDIREAAQRGATLTRQLLTFSRRQPSQARPTDVDQSLTALRPMLERLLGEDVLLEIQRGAGSARVLVDPGQLDQIVVNLAVNSRDAMPGGGKITIATELVSGLSPEPSVAIRVTDTGSGMDAATKGLAFEPFFTTKGDRGTGLGLSVVRNIVQLAGGTIQCDSEPGRGTTFLIVLPTVIANATPAHGSRPASRRVSRKVVLVDDDARVRAAVSRALQSVGVAVDAVSLPVDVADLERRLRGADALVTDIVMPVLTGPDLVDELRRRGNQTPVIFVSGHAEHALVERVRGAPNALLIAKPFRAEDVLAGLDELCGPTPAPSGSVLPS